MKLHILFHHYEDDPRLMPNAVAIMDEYTIETAGWDVWEEEKRDAMTKMGPGSYREAIITISGRFAKSLFEAQSSVALKEEKM